MSYNTFNIMNNQNPGFSGAFSGGNAHEFNPLTVLAEVVIEDARRESSQEDTVMQDAGTWTGDTRIEDVHDTTEHDVDPHHLDQYATADQSKSEQDEASSSNPNESHKKLFTADQLYSMLEDISSPTMKNLNDEESDNENSDTGMNSSIKAYINAKGKGKAKSKNTAAKRSATVPQVMGQMTSKEEANALRESKYNEEDLHGAEAEAGSPLQAKIEATGMVLEEAILIASLAREDSETESGREELMVSGAKRRSVHEGKQSGVGKVNKKLNFFESMSNYPELFMEMAKHLRINDLVSVYCISKDFNETINGHLSHILKACAAYQAPESSRIFPFTLYRHLCIFDPVGRPDHKDPSHTRMVPSLRWLRMVIHREKCVRDILACMAREGHRMPKTMSLSIKKMWLTMDIPTSARRVQLLHNESFVTDDDLFNLQMLFVKLDMRFNDPIKGPGDDGLRKLMLGQRGLTPLCHLLKRTRFTDALEAIEACIKYSYRPRPEHRNLPIFGIPANEVGRGHLEGWGSGKVHLYRMDELVMREACRRNLDLKAHILSMVAWGYVDADTKENIQVTREERYMSDDDDVKEREKLVIDDGRRQPRKVLSTTNISSVDISKQRGETDRE